MQKHPPVIMYGIKSLVTVSMETKQGMKILTCDCVQSCRFELFTVFEIQGSKLNNNNNKKQKKKNWENKLFVISPLLMMQFLPYFRYTCMLPIATILL